MDQYTILQQGSSNDADAVKKLQQTLYDKGYTQVGSADGIYGPKTAAAVKAYQTENGLLADGIAGQQTLTALYAEQSQEPEVPQEPESPAATEREEFEQLKLQGAQVSQAYQEQLQDLYEKIVNGPAYSYNVNEDAFFSQYADQYHRAGQLAMENAMGQAAALTGGYGSSYSQSAGQQAYQQHMAKLAEVVPVLESAAYDRYRQGREDQLEQYALLWQQADDAYGRYMDQLQQQWKELENAQDSEELAWQREQEAYSRLTALLAIGYRPTGEELAAAGMTREQADAILKNYTTSRYSHSGSAGSTGSTEKEEIPEIDFKSIGVTNDMELGNILRIRQKTQGNEGLRELLSYWVSVGYINSVAMEGLYAHYSKSESEEGESFNFWEYLKKLLS